MNNKEIDLEGVQYLCVGPATYKVAGKTIQAKGLTLATGLETATLLHASLCSTNNTIKNAPLSAFIRDSILKDSWINVFNRNTWTPQSAKNAGVYVQYDSKAQGYARVADISALNKQSSKKDTTTTFAPLNKIKGGEHEYNTLAKNAFVVANYTLQGAKLLDEVAKTLSLKPAVWIMNNESSKPVQTLSSIYIETPQPGQTRIVIMGWGLKHLQDENPRSNEGYSFGVRHLS